MSRNLRSRRKIRIILLAGIVITSFATGIYLARNYYHPSRTSLDKQAEERQAPMKIKRPKTQVLIFIPKQTSESTYLVPVTIEVPANCDLPVAAMEGLIAKSEEKGSSHNLIPVGTKVLGVKISKGIAEVNLSRDFITNFSGGSHQEGLTLNAIFHTMGQFNGVKKTRILIEGKPTDTLGGHIDTSAPMEADPEWLEGRANN